MLKQRIPQIFTLIRNLQAHFKYKKRRGRIFSDTSSLSGDPLGARSQDPNIKSVVLYLLS